MGDCCCKTAFLYIRPLKKSYMKVLLWLTLLSITAVTKAADWKEYYSNGMVKVFYTTRQCHDNANGIHQEKIFFKFQNTGSQKALITFTKALTYNGKTIKPEGENRIVLNAGETREATCAEKDKSYFIMVKHLDMNGRVLDHFELQNITITVIP